MVSIKRTPFQGVSNIIRFNWHFFVIAAKLVLGLMLLSFSSSGLINNVIFILIVLVVLTTIVSLATSFYIYDLSGLYTLQCLNIKTEEGNIVNINAGFDETSAIISSKYPKANLTVFDFYDSEKHTEISIERARKAYPPYPDTLKINTQSIPLETASVDYILLILSAHEIRNNLELVVFFKQLKTALKPNGKIIVVEHQRDFANFLAYNIGFLHFLSPTTWAKTFQKAGLTVESKTKHTSFISIFTLSKWNSI